jgi:transposase InsO family protein
MTEIPTAAATPYLATVIDLYSRRLLGAATGRHPDATLACSAITMAVAARGGAAHISGVIFHTDRGSTYTAEKFTALCRRLGIRQSMGRLGSCLDNAAAEAFFSSLEWEVLCRHAFATTTAAHRSTTGPPSTEKRHTEPSTISGEPHWNPPSRGGLFVLHRSSRRHPPRDPLGIRPLQNARRAHFLGMC